MLFRSARTEQEEIGGEDWERSFYFDHEKNPLEKVITRIFDRLVHTASRRFGVGGRPLQLPDDELRDEFVDKDHVDHFDPAALWAALVARYQGENGERTAFVQAAREIAREFRAEHGTKLAQVSGRVALSCTMYGDTCRFTKRYGHC